MIKKVDVTIVCKAEKDNVFDGFDDEKLIKILDESAGKVNNECCKVGIQPNLKWQKLKEFISNRSSCAGYVVQARLIWDILDKMRELEGEDE